MSSVGNGSASIVVADDDALIRLVVRAALEGAGYHVLEAADGTDALRVIESGSIDLAILDAHMPGPGLEQLLGRVAGIPAPPAVIVLSGDRVDETTLRRYRTGTADGDGPVALMKPIEMASLLAAVRHLLDRASDRESHLSLSDDHGHAHP